MKYVKEALKTAKEFEKTKAPWKHRDRTPDCLPLSQIERFVAEGFQVIPLNEQKHLETCYYCGLNRRLFEKRHSPIQTLMAALCSDDETVRVGAVKVLGGDVGTSVVLALIRALFEESEPIRDRAAQAWGRIGVPAAVPTLLEVFWTLDKSVIVSR